MNAHHRETRVSGFEMSLLHVKAQPVSDFPLVRTMCRFIELAKILKANGFKFKPTPNSFFFSEKPSGEYHTYYDSRTDSYIHIQKDANS